MSHIGLKPLSERSGPTSLRTGLQWIGGLVPATCVKDGRTLKAGRDGSIGILFDANHSGLRVRPRVLIGDDGEFALRLEHKADVGHAESYSVSIRGTFGRKTVSGRVKGTSSSEFSGRCRADRSFTAKLTKG